MSFRERWRFRMTRTLVCAAAAVALISAWISNQRVGGAAPAPGEWRAYAADKAASRYSPVDQINKDTVKNLRIVWRQSIIPTELREGRSDVAVPNVSQNTPLMVGGLLYVSTALGTVAALNPENGNVV